MVRIMTATLITVAPIDKAYHKPGKRPLLVKSDTAGYKGGDIQSA